MGSLPRSILVAVTSLAAMAVGPMAGEVVLSEMISYDRLRNATLGDDLTHEFSQEPAAVRVTVECKLKRGVFAWRVETPDGEVLWRQQIGGRTRIELDREFPGEAGEWRVVLDYKNATGRYRVKMEAVPRP